MLPQTNNYYYCFKQIKVAANKLKLLQTRTKSLCARRNRERLALAVQCQEWLRMAQNGGNSDAVMINPRGDVLYPLRCRGSFYAANFCYSCGKELNEKADEPKSRKLS